MTNSNEALRKHLEGKFNTSLRVTWGGAPDRCSIVLDKAIYDDDDRNLIKRIARYLPCCCMKVTGMTRGNNIAIRAQDDHTAFAGLMHNQLSKM